MGKCEGTGVNFHGHVTVLTVAPTHRRQGIATELMKKLEDVSENSGAYFVDLFVRKSNEAAVKMYEKMGYSIYRTILDYYCDPREDAYDMRKALSRDKEKRSVRPITKPVSVADLHF